jgi:hypothetical protein
MTTAASTIDLTAIDPRTASPDAIRAGLWQAILTGGAEVTGGERVSRDQAYYNSDGNSCQTTFSTQRPDGMRDYWIITAHYRPSRIPGARLGVEVRHTYNAAEDFWNPIVAAAAKDRLCAVVIEGHCYSIQPDSRNPGWGDGFNGRRHDIEWLDGDGKPTGEKLATRNLWARGVVPPPYRETLKDNARWTGGKR